MYDWYRRARVCIAYLSDFEHRESWGNSSFVRDFESCTWFTRGWTLQELLAPRRVDFYNRDWQKIGGRDTLCKVNAIARARGISADDLYEPIAQISVDREIDAMGF
jgi:hypothetical protein